MKKIKNEEKIISQWDKELEVFDKTENFISRNIVLLTGISIFIVVVLNFLFN